MTYMKSCYDLYISTYVITAYAISVLLSCLSKHTFERCAIDFFFVIMLKNTCNETMHYACIALL
jgi:hypothetical protein